MLRSETGEGVGIALDLVVVAHEECDGFLFGSRDVVLGSHQNKTHNSERIVHGNKKGGTKRRGNKSERSVVYVYGHLSNWPAGDSLDA